MDQQGEDIFKVVVAGTLILLFLGICIVFFVIQYKRRQEKFWVEKHNMEQKFHQELLLTQIEIQEQTLQNISQEIHDNIGQSLSLAKLNLNTYNISKPEQAQYKVDSTKELVSKAIHDLRNLSRSLNMDSVLAAGLKGAIDHELEMLERSESFATSLVIEGAPVRFNPKKELIAFRIFQEAINNIIKHANATVIDVQLKYTNQYVSLCISDNGSGFTEKDNHEGSGLRNMKNRSVLIGGEFIIRSGLEGTTIQISIPLEST